MASNLGSTIIQGNPHREGCKDIKANDPAWLSMKTELAHQDFALQPIRAHARGHLEALALACTAAPLSAATNVTQTLQLPSTYAASFVLGVKANAAGPSQNR